MKIKKILNPREVLYGAGTSGKSLGLSRVNSPVLYVSEPDDTLLLAEAAKIYITIPSRTATFHGLSFCRATRTMLRELHEFYRNSVADMYSKFMSFSTARLQCLSGKSHSAMHFSEKYTSIKVQLSRQKGTVGGLSFAGIRAPYL